MSDASKTTYNTLANNSSDSAIAGFNALVNTASPSHKADLQRRLTDAIRYSAPAIGDYWNGQGGIYAGIVRNGDRQWHLILGCTIRYPRAIATTYHYSVDDRAFTGAWGKYPSIIEGEFSRIDGHHNTQLILAGDPHNYLANAITALEIEGHKDFYWPAQLENNLFRINLSEHISPDKHWSSTQHSSLEAWQQNGATGDQTYFIKSRPMSARAARRIPIE